MILPTKLQSGTRRSVALEQLPQAGKQVAVYANRGMRLATVLAVRGSQALVEYRMPGGTSALRIVDFPLTNNWGWCGQTVPYTLLSLPWLFEIVAAHQQWHGCPQRHGGTRPVPPVETLLNRKLFERGFTTFWHTPPAAELLQAIQAQPRYWDVTGWVNGACGIAALGIVNWIRQSCEPDLRVALCAMSGTDHPVAHVFVTVTTPTWEYCLDTEGFRRRESLVRRWFERYQLERAHIVAMRESEKAFKAVHIPYSKQISAGITVGLQRYCGDFSLWLHN